MSIKSKTGTYTGRIVTIARGVLPGDFVGASLHSRQRGDTVASSDAPVQVQTVTATYVVGRATKAKKVEIVYDDKRSKQKLRNLISNKRVRSGADTTG